MSRFGQGLTVSMVAGVFLAASSAAFALTDPVTGFAIDPPAPFRTSLVQAKPKLVDYAVTSATGVPAIAGGGSTLCKVRYEPAVRDAIVTPDWLNGRTEDEDWRKTKRRALAPALTIVEEAVFTLSDIKGVEYIAIPKAGPNAADVRVHLSILETPRGRLTQTCATPLAGFDAALVQFRQIRSTISLPR